MSDPLTEPLEPGQVPYHLRDYKLADPEVERRHLALINDMQRRQREAPTVAQIKARDMVPKQKD